MHWQLPRLLCSLHFHRRGRINSVSIFLSEPIFCGSTAHNNNEPSLSFLWAVGHAPTVIKHCQNTVILPNSVPLYLFRMTHLLFHVKKALKGRISFWLMWPHNRGPAQLTVAARANCPDKCTPPGFMANFRFTWGWHVHERRSAVNPTNNSGETNAPL